ncbi:Reverse transcriptase zinc-binding domain [Sesbania bispinosa]|nr:Reverse transcriptase zinc-binding domain [Sesbania bispinosa]
MLYGWGVVEKGLRWRIGSGDQISFWSDRWLRSGDILLDNVLAEVPVTRLHGSVCDLSNGSGSWELNHISGLLYPQHLQEIGATLAAVSGSEIDRPLWRWSPDGTFTTKSAYESITADLCPHSTINWKTIWNWLGPYRVQHFLWLVLKGGLKTNALHFEKGMIESDLCPLCNSLAESSSHILRDCPQVTPVWHHFYSQGGPVIALDEDITSWIFKNLARSDVTVSSLSWSLLFGIICHCIWQHRNELIFKQKNWDPSRLIFQAISTARDFSLSVCATGSLPQIRPTPCLAADRRAILLSGLKVTHS